jgi:hypothetical protein
VALEAPVVRLGRCERREVVRARERCGARLQRVEVSRVRPPQRAAALERGRRPAREHAVEVRAAPGVVPRAEAVRHLLGGEHRDLVGQQRVDRTQERERPLVGHHLPERVDAAVGAAGHDEVDVLAQDDAQRSAQLPRHRPFPRLHGPPGKGRAVIGQGQFCVRLTHPRKLG